MACVSNPAANSVPTPSNLVHLGERQVATRCDLARSKVVALTTYGLANSRRVFQPPYSPAGVQAENRLGTFFVAKEADEPRPATDRGHPQQRFSPFLPGHSLLTTLINPSVDGIETLRTPS